MDACAPPCACVRLVVIAKRYYLSVISQLATFEFHYPPATLRNTHRNNLSPLKALSK